MGKRARKLLSEYHGNASAVGKFRQILAEGERILCYRCRGVADGYALQTFT